MVLKAGATDLIPLGKLSKLVWSHIIYQIDVLFVIEAKSVALNYVLSYMLAVLIEGQAQI